MQRPIIEKAHPLTKIMFVVLLIVVSGIVVMALAALLGMLFFGSSSIMGAFTGNLEEIAALKYLQMSQSVALFLVPALLAGVFFSKHTFHYLYFNSFNINSATVGLVTLLVFMSVPFIDFTGYLNEHMQLPAFLSGLENWMKQMEATSSLLIEKFTNTNNLGGLMINVIMIGVLPALSEEMLFRGTLQPLFKTWFRNNNIAIWITAIIFSAFHLQFYGFIPRLLLGAVMGYLLVWSGSLWLPIVAHFVNNTLGVVLYYMFYNGVIQVSPDELGFQNSYVQLIISSMIVVALLVIIYRQCRMPRSETQRSISPNI